MKRIIILVIIGATGTVTKGLKKNMESLQHTTILGTSHITEGTAV